MTGEEDKAIRAAVDAYRQGPLWDRDNLHLWLALPLLRRLAAGMIDSLDGPEAREFLADRKVVRGPRNLKQPTAEEFMAYAKELRRDPGYWSIIQQLADTPRSGRALALHEKIGLMRVFENIYCLKYGYFNRRWPYPVNLLIKVAESEIADLDSPEVWAWIREELAEAKKQEERYS